MFFVSKWVFLCQNGRVFLCYVAHPLSFLLTNGILCLVLCRFSVRLCLFVLFFYIFMGFCVYLYVFVLTLYVSVWFCVDF